MRTILITLFAVALFTAAISFSRGGEGENKLPFTEKTNEGLEFRFLPLLDENGKPKAVYCMIINTNAKAISLKTSGISKGYLGTMFGVKKTEDGDITELNTEDRLSNFDSQPVANVYVLEQNAFVGLAVTITEDSMKMISYGMILHASAAVDIISGFADGDESAMKKYRLVGSADFPIHEYKTAQNGASKVKTAK